MKCRIYIASSLPMYSFHPLYTTYTCSVARSQAWQEILSRMSPQLRRDTYREVNVHWVKKARRGPDGAFGWGWDMDGLGVEDIFRTEFSRKALACFFQWTWNQDWNERWQGFGLSFNCTPQQMLSFGNEGMREWEDEEKMHNQAGINFKDPESSMYSSCYIDERQPVLDPAVRIWV